MICVCPERRPHGNAASEDINSDDGDGCVDRGCCARLLPITQSWRTFITLATRPPQQMHVLQRKAGKGKERKKGKKGVERRGGECGGGGEGEKGVGGVSATSNGGGAAKAKFPP